MQHLRNLSGWGCAKSSQSPQIFAYRDRMRALRSLRFQLRNRVPDVVAALDSQRRMNHIDNAAQIGHLCPKCFAILVCLALIIPQPLHLCAHVLHLGQEFVALLNHALNSLNRGLITSPSQLFARFFCAGALLIDNGLELSALGDQTVSL